MNKREAIIAALVLILPLILVPVIPIFAGAGVDASASKPTVKAEFQVSPERVTFNYNVSQNVSSTLNPSTNTSKTETNGTLSGEYVINETTIYADLQGSFESLTKLNESAGGAESSSDMVIALKLRGDNSSFNGYLKLYLNMSGGGAESSYDFYFALMGEYSQISGNSTVSRMKAVMNNGTATVNTSVADVKATVEQTSNTTLISNNTFETTTIFHITANSTSSDPAAAQMGIMPFIILSGNLMLRPNMTFDPMSNKYMFSVEYTKKQSSRGGVPSEIDTEKMSRYNISIEEFEAGFNSTVHVTATKDNTTSNATISAYLLVKGNFSQGIPLAGLTGYTVLRSLTGSIKLSGDMLYLDGSGVIDSPDLFLTQEGIRGFTLSTMHGASSDSVVKVRGVGGVELAVGDEITTNAVFTSTNYTEVKEFYIVVNGTIMQSPGQGALIFRQIRDEGEIHAIILSDTRVIVVETPFNNPVSIKPLARISNITIAYRPSSGGLNISSEDGLRGGKARISIIDIDPPTGYKALSKTYDADMEISGTVNITIYLEAPARGQVYVAHRLSNGTWEILRPIASGENYVTVTLNSLSPVVAVEEETVTTTTTTTTSSTTATTTTTSTTTTSTTTTSPATTTSTSVTSSTTTTTSPTTTTTVQTTTTTTRTTATSTPSPTTTTTTTHTTTTSPTTTTTTTMTTTTQTTTKTTRTTTSSTQSTTATHTTTTATSPSKTTSSTSTRTTMTSHTTATTTTSSMTHKTTTTSSSSTTATSSTPQSTTSTVPITSPTTTTGKKETNTAVIAGIILALIIIAGAAFMLRRK